MREAMSVEGGGMKVGAGAYAHELEVALRLAREAGAAILGYYD